MRYMGGKDRISDALEDVLSGFYDVATCYVEPFVGGASVAAKVRMSPMILSDAYAPLADMYRHVHAGGELPDVCTEEQWRAAVYEPVAGDPLTAFYRFGSSFGGVGDSYGRCDSGVNYCASARRSLLRKMRHISRYEPTFHAVSYDDLDIPDGALVYCDPPYACTRRYVAIGAFDTDVFWEWVRSISGRCYVVVSEYGAPDDMRCVFDAPKLVSMRRLACTTVSDRAFVHIGGLSDQRLTEVGTSRQRSLF